MTVGRLALDRILQGYGYEVTSLDVCDAYRHFIAAAQKLGLGDCAIRDAIGMANEAKAKQPTGFADISSRPLN
jgi:hypothetical protein